MKETTMAALFQPLTPAIARSVQAETNSASGGGSNSGGGGRRRRRKKGGRRGGRRGSRT